MQSPSQTLKKLKRMAYTKITKEQKQVMWAELLENPKGTHNWELIAHVTGLPIKVIKSWFSNTKSKMKKQQPDPRSPKVEGMRTRITKEQMQVLKAELLKNPKGGRNWDLVAHITGLPIKFIKSWFWKPKHKMKNSQGKRNDRCSTTSDLSSVCLPHKMDSTSNDPTPRRNTLSVKALGPYRDEDNVDDISTQLVEAGCRSINLRTIRSAFIRKFWTRNLLCIACQIKFTDVEEYTQHLFSHMRHGCIYCDCTFVRYKSLVTHVKSHHSPLGLQFQPGRFCEVQNSCDSDVSVEKVSDPPFARDPQLIDAPPSSKSGHGNLSVLKESPFFNNLNPTLLSTTTTATQSQGSQICNRILEVIYNANDKTLETRLTNEEIAEPCNSEPSSLTSGFDFEESVDTPPENQWDEPLASGVIPVVDKLDDEIASNCVSHVKLKKLSVRLTRSPIIDKMCRYGDYKSSGKKILIENQQLSKHRTQSCLSMPIISESPGSSKKMGNHFQMNNLTCVGMPRSPDISCNINHIDHEIDSTNGMENALLDSISGSANVPGPRAPSAMEPAHDHKQKTPKKLNSVVSLWEGLPPNELRNLTSDLTNSAILPSSSKRISRRPNTYTARSGNLYSTKRVTRSTASGTKEHANYEYNYHKYIKSTYSSSKASKTRGSKSGPQFKLHRSQAREHSARIEAGLIYSPTKIDECMADPGSLGKKNESSSHVGNDFILDPEPNQQPNIFGKADGVAVGGVLPSLNLRSACNNVESTADVDCITHTLSGNGEVSDERTDRINAELESVIDFMENVPSPIYWYDESHPGPSKAADQPTELQVLDCASENNHPPHPEFLSSDPPVRNRPTSSVKYSSVHMEEETQASLNAPNFHQYGSGFNAVCIISPGAATPKPLELNEIDVGAPHSPVHRIYWGSSEDEHDDAQGDGANKGRVSPASSDSSDLEGFVHDHGSPFLQFPDSYNSETNPSSVVDIPDKNTSSSKAIEPTIEASPQGVYGSGCGDKHNCDKQSLSSASVESTQIAVPDRNTKCLPHINANQEASSSWGFFGSEDEDEQNATSNVVVNRESQKRKSQHSLTRRSDWDAKKQHLQKILHKIDIMELEPLGSHKRPGSPFTSFKARECASANEEQLWHSRELGRITASMEPPDGHHDKNTPGQQQLARNVTMFFGNDGPSGPVTYSESSVMNEIEKYLQVPDSRGSKLSSSQRDSYSFNDSAAPGNCPSTPVCNRPLAVFSHVKSPEVKPLPTPQTYSDDDDSDSPAISLSPDNTLDDSDF